MTTKVAFTDREVGRFALVRVIADDRAEAVRKARRAVEPERVIDIAQVTPQSIDEWFVELQVAR